MYFSKVLANIPELQNPIPDSIWAVIKGLLEGNPDQRLTISQVLAMSIFKRSDVKLTEVKLTETLIAIKEAKTKNKVTFTYMSKAKNINYYDSDKNETSVKVAVSAAQRQQSASTADDYGTLAGNSQTNVYHVKRNK